MSRIWNSGLIVLVIGAAAPIRLAGQAADAPRFVVPDVSDLSVKIRRSFDRRDSTITTEILRLKGAWQRREQIFDFPRTLPTGNRQSQISITRCDERRTLLLNEHARTFAWLPIEDLAERLRWVRLAARRRPQPVETGPEVTITVDSVDHGGAAAGRPLHRASRDHHNHDEGGSRGEGSRTGRRSGRLVHRLASAELLGAGERVRDGVRDDDADRRGRT
jgi:hypothetical protein